MMFEEYNLETIKKALALVTRYQSPGRFPTTRFHKLIKQIAGFEEELVEAKEKLEHPTEYIDSLVLINLILGKKRKQK